MPELVGRHAEKYMGPIQTFVKRYRRLIHFLVYHQLTMNDTVSEPLGTVSKDPEHQFVDRGVEPTLFEMSPQRLPWSGADQAEHSPKRDQALASTLLEAKANAGPIWTTQQPSVRAGERVGPESPLAFVQARTAAHRDFSELASAHRMNRVEALAKLSLVNPLIGGSAQVTGLSLCHAFFDSLEFVGTGQRAPAAPGVALEHDVRVHQHNVASLH